MMNKSATTNDEFIDFVDDDDQSSSSFVDQIDFQHYIRICRKHKWPIMLFTAMVTGLAGYYAYTATPIYQATSTLLIESQKQNVVSVEELIGLDNENGDYLSTQIALLKSRQLGERVVDRMQLWNYKEYGGEASSSSIPAQIADADIAGNEEPLSLADKITEFFDNLGRISEEAIGNGTGVSSEAAGSDSLLTALNNAEGQSVQPRVGVSADSQAFPLSEEQILRNNVVGQFRNRLTVTPLRNTRLVELSFESSDAELAMNVSNVVGEEYISSYLDSRLALTTTATEWLNERLVSLKSDLDGSEDRLIRFKQENGLVDVDGSVGRLNEQELLLATNELAAARSELAAADNLVRQVNDLQDQPALLQSVVAVQNDPLVRQVKLDLGQAQRNLDELLNRYGDRHPRVIDATSQIATLNTSLESHVNRVVDSIQKNYQLLVQRVSGIEAKLVTGKQEIQALGTKTFELQALEREVATKRSIYDTFFNRMTEARSADGLDAANARISDYATLPNSPIKPKKQLIIALAALASLILSMLMAILYEQLDDTVKSIADVEDKINAKLLGLLPLLRSGALRKGSDLPLNPLTLIDKRGTFFEAVDTVRTSICMKDGANPAKIIVVTSSIPGEGKSTVSVNLAYSMSKIERVLLIDCDLRRPTLSKVVGLKEEQQLGLSDFISGTARASQCICRGVLDGSFDLLPAGRHIDQPLELLSSKRFEKILEGLSQYYDRIILDSAPMQAVSDAMVLSRYSDAVLYVVKSQDTRLDTARNGVQRLREINAPVLGVILSQVDLVKMANYGGDYFYQGYYDYYGYRRADMPDSSEGSLQLTQADIIRMRTDDRDVEIDLDPRRSFKLDSDSDLLEDDLDLDHTMRLETSGFDVSRKTALDKKSKIDFY